MGFDNFQSIIHSLDKLFHSGSSISNGMGELIKVANIIASDINGIANKSKLMIDEIVKSVHKSTNAYPQILKDINKTVMTLNVVLHWMLVAIIFAMILCCFCCLLSSFTTYHNIYGIKKVQLIHNAKSKTCNTLKMDIKETESVTEDIEIEQAENTESGQLHHITIDIEK